MREVQEQPPFYDELGKTFRLSEGTIFTFGDVIYNPSGNPISKPLYKHEEQHSKQQGGNPKEWWARYIKDPDFRLSQEVSAYQVQYKESKKHIKDRNELHRYLRRLASDLSSPLYGDCISFSEAYDAIKRDKLYEFPS